MALLSVSFWFFGFLKAPNKTSMIHSGQHILPQSTEEAAANLDSDGDGLKDWEEALYHTDPHNPDTDGDGTPDGQEIREGRDPLKKGPNDKILSPKSVATANNSEDNFTQDLGKSFFNNYLKSKLADPTNQTDNQLSANMILQGLMHSPNMQSISFPTVSEKDIHTTQDNSPEAVKTYINAIATITGRSIGSLDDTLLLLASILQQTDVTSQLVRLDPILQDDRDMIEKLKQTHAPSSWEDYHKRLINIFLKIETVTQSFRNIDRDALKAMLMAQEYQNATQELQSLGSEAKQILDTTGVVFQDTDPAKQVFHF